VPTHNTCLHSSDKLYYSSYCRLAHSQSRLHYLFTSHPSTLQTTQLHFPLQAFGQLNSLYHTTTYHNHITMAPSTKRRAADELDSSPTTKRQRTEAPTSPQEALVLSSPAPRRASRTPIRRSATPTAPVVSASPDDSDLESDIDSDTESGDDALLERIQAGVEYTRAQQRLGEAVKQTTRFTLSTDTPSRALSLLRRYGTLIVSAADFEEYELAVPRPDGVKEGILPGLHDPQWWVGLSAAEMKAGPHADEAGVKRAAAHLKGLQPRRTRRRGRLRARKRSTGS
jgi:hypothetical protein